MNTVNAKNVFYKSWSENRTPVLVRTPIKLTKRLGSGLVFSFVGISRSFWFLTLSFIPSGSSVTVAEERSNFPWIIEPKGDLVLSGSTFKFNCSAMYFNKHVHYYWKFNDTDIKVNDSSSQFTMRNIPNGVQLVIKNVTLKNQGKYQCFAKPTGDNITFKGSAAMLKVKVVATPTGDKYKKNHSCNTIILYMVCYVPLRSPRRKQGFLNFYKGVV